jgi:hypothetical protein
VRPARRPPLRSHTRRIGSLLLVALARGHRHGRPETLRYLVAVIVVALSRHELSDRTAQLPLLVLEAVCGGRDRGRPTIAVVPLLMLLPSTTIAAGLAAATRDDVTGGRRARAARRPGLRGADPAARLQRSARSGCSSRCGSGVLAPASTACRGAVAMGPLRESRRCSRSCGRDRGLEGSLDPGTVAQTLMLELHAAGRAGTARSCCTSAATSSSRWRCTATSGSLARRPRRGRPHHPRLAVRRARSSTAPARHRGGGVRSAARCWCCRSRRRQPGRRGRPRVRGPSGSYAPRLTRAAVQAVERHALPLETASLFDELRIAAAARSAVARP